MSTIFLPFYLLAVSIDSIVIVELLVRVQSLYIVLNISMLCWNPKLWDRKFNKLRWSDGEWWWWWSSSCEIYITQCEDWQLMVIVKLNTMVWYDSQSTTRQSGGSDQLDVWFVCDCLCKQYCHNRFSFFNSFWASVLDFYNILIKVLTPYWVGKVKL